MKKFFTSIFIVILIKFTIETIMEWRSTIWLDFISVFLFIVIVNPSKVIRSLEKEKRKK